MLAKSWQSRSIYVLLCLPALDFEPRKYLIYKEKYGGEGGIRTLGTLRYTRFPGVIHRPLGHLTML